MASAVVDSFQLLDSRMFSRVLNIYVADNAQNFIAATLSLLGADRLCDFSVALMRRPANGSFVAYNSHNQTWDSAFVQLQATLLRAIRSQAAPEQNVVVTQPTAENHAPEILERYRHEILERMGSTHAALLFLGEHCDPSSILISVHRTGGAPEFDSLEVARLDTFRRYIENAWSLLTQRLLSRVLIDGISLAMRKYDFGIVMLDSRLRVVWHNRAARASVLTWADASRNELKPGRQLGRMPGDILSACEKLRAEWLESPSLGRLRRIHLVRHPSQRGHCATVRLYGVRFTGIASPNFIVQFEQHFSGPASANSSIMHSLTSTERDVAQLVRQGLSNQEIADALGKSVDAVKFHLHRMFKKAEVTTRSRLMLVLT